MCVYIYMYTGEIQVSLSEKNFNSNLPSERAEVTVAAMGVVALRRKRRGEKKHLVIIWEA